jgi:hypothetical protein
VQHIGKATTKGLLAVMALKRLQLTARELQPEAKGTSYNLLAECYSAPVLIRLREIGTLSGL